MPEGDTVWLTADNLNKAIGGQVLTGCDVRVPAFATVDLTGETVHDVASRGKHLLHHIGDLTLHTHLKMEGSWHLYRPGTPWRRPAHQARVILSTADWVTVGFSLGVVEFVPTTDKDDVVGYLGPDLLGDFDATLALARVTASPEVPVFVALLDQRNLAGIGNVYANELCFLRGMLPTRPVSEDPDAAATVALAKRLLVANRGRVDRSTTGDLRSGRNAWVYGRAGKPCLRCGTRIRRGKLGATALTERDTYWCPRCQT
ncbi:endonuclease-8 [Conyzicola lurida]|uniref:DNA-(apurinic or apyrimidinic site) lyase n=1 Tax=Conyzicola lurida TaxID=1172621 RepID=A0A841AEV8_9MICO|nr:Fpg/Nei family DNA glycosylase [Conyzicola lurida]MBB5841777.1 endonuclease-8 [Conyzicola lurida]